MFRLKTIKIEIFLNVPSFFPSFPTSPPVNRNQEYRRECYSTGRSREHGENARKKVRSPPSEGELADNP